MNIFCYESCRLFHPQEIAGDYIRNTEYQDHKLAEHYPQYFKAKNEVLSNSPIDNISVDGIAEFVENTPPSVGEGAKKKAKD